MCLRLLFCIIFALQRLNVLSASSRLSSRIDFSNYFEIEREYGPVSGATSSPNSSFGNTVQFIDQYFLQKLDHTRPTDNRTWYQRYFVNDLYYEEGGPVFLFVFGESEAYSKWMGKGPQWTTYAKKKNALCIGLEHRFYGKSRPKENTSTSSLQYLTTEQVLADIAYFIEGMNQKCNLSSNTKWILFGGSYAGSLVAWARMKYPHLIHGAVASSAPLLAKTDFPEYMEVVERSLNRYSKSCAKNIATANQYLKRAVKTKRGRAKVSKMFKFCSVLQNNPDDISFVFEMLADNIAYAVQYNRKIFSIHDVCDMMNDDEISPLERYANVNNVFLKLLNVSCTSPKYVDALAYWKNESHSSSYQQSSRLWLYQTCSEYGFFQTSNKPKDLFGANFPVKYFIKICEDVFGKQFNKAFVDDAVHRTNIEFGGLSFNSSNIIFIHGLIDPWHALGITDSKKSAAWNLFVMKGTAHCGDMYPSSDDDSEELRATRDKIFEILKSWLESKESNTGSTQEVVNFQINGEDQSVSMRPEVIVV